MITREKSWLQNYSFSAHVRQTPKGKARFLLETQNPSAQQFETDANLLSLMQNNKTPRNIGR